MGMEIVRLRIRTTGETLESTDDFKCSEQRKAHICESSADSTGQAGMLDKLFFFI